MSGDIRHALRDAVEQFRADADPLDKHARDVLDRLTADEWRDHVLPAFKAVPPQKWPTLLRDCIYAERETRLHRHVVAGARQQLNRAKEAEALLGKLGKLVIKARGEWTIVSGGDRAQEGLKMVLDDIRSSRRIAEMTLRQHSRKTDPAAAILGGVGWLKESLSKLAVDAPILKLTADLAVAVLDSGKEVTEAMAWHALTPRERVRR